MTKINTILEQKMSETKIAWGENEPQDQDASFTFPEMSDIEKEIIIEWCSLAENENYKDEPFNGLNLRELLKILSAKYNETTRVMPNMSIQDRLVAMGWRPYVDSEGRSSVLHNPMCSLLMIRIILSIATKEQDDTSDIYNKLLEKFDVFKKYYFDI